MADSKIVRIDEEAHALLEKLAKIQRPPATMQSMASQLIRDAWAIAASRPNPDVSLEQVTDAK